MELKLPEKREKGQVGIGTLIVFIAMVLVAAIAAGVLINTAGFLQSQSQQTGEESSAQVTNQLQVLSTTGQVTAGESAAETTVDRIHWDLDDTDSTETYLAGETTVGVDYNDVASGSGGSADSGDVEISDGNGNTITVNTGSDGSNVVADTTFTPLNTSAYQVQVQSDVASGSDDTIVVDLSAGDTLTVSGSDDDISVQASSDDTDTDNLALANGETLDVDEVVKSTAQLSLGDSTSSIEVLDDGTFSVRTSADSVTVKGDDSGTTQSFDVDSSEFSLDVEVVDKTHELDLDGNTGTDNYRITGPDGNSIVIGDDATSETLQFSEDVTLSNSGTDVNVDGDSDLQAESLEYVPADTAGTEPLIDSVEVIVTRSPGASDIDMSQTTINFIAPDGSHDLTYSDSASPEEDSTFTLDAIQDGDNTLPVLSSGDRFTVNIDPGTLEAGTTSELRVTTPSGATKSLLVRVPDSLANQEAVGL
jgi:flagellin FlaA/flagellin FlaB